MVMGQGNTEVRSDDNNNNNDDRNNNYNNATKMDVDTTAAVRAKLQAETKDWR